MSMTGLLRLVTQYISAAPPELHIPSFCVSSAYPFYEKVVKVKADVAAFLNFFSRSTAQIEADHLDAAPVVPIGGMRKGGFSGAL